MRKYTSEDEIFIWLQPFNDRPVLAAGNIMDSDSNVYEQISNQIQKGDQEFENIQEKNKVFFSVYQDKYNLGAYTLIPRDLLNKNQKILNENLILITLIMLAVVSISFYFVSRLLSRPLEEMTKTVKRIQSGETQLRMENLRNDEVGELGKSFNNMLDQIEKLIADEYENKMSLNYARYQALQAQINPHFLYNTLDTMGSIAEIQGCIQVSNLCQSLAGLFRYSLDMKNPLSTVSGELVHLKNYIYVMNVRMQNQVEYEFHIDDNVLQDTLPRISIQPLVENALNHGLKNQKGKKKVIISAGIREDDLLISVEDNGIGMSDEKIRELFSEDPGEKQKNRSIGIFNIHKRMQYLYGESYGVKIKSEPERVRLFFWKFQEKYRGRIKMHVKSYKVLFADDEYWTREKMARIIPWEKYSLEFLKPASDGEEVLERLSEEKPDILITDINMPYVNGVELLKKVHTEYPEMITFVISGYDDFEYVRDSFLSGSIHYLMKPVGKIDLINALSKALELISQRQSKKEEELQKQQELQRASSFIKDREFSQLLDPKTASSSAGFVLNSHMEFAGGTLILVKIHRLQEFMQLYDYDMNLLLSVKNVCRKSAVILNCLFLIIFTVPMNF